MGVRGLVEAGGMKEVEGEGEGEESEIVRGKEEDIRSTQPSHLLQRVHLGPNLRIAANDNRLIRRSEKDSYHDGWEECVEFWIDLLVVLWRVGGLIVGGFVVGGCLWVCSSIVGGRVDGLMLSNSPGISIILPLFVTVCAGLPIMAGRIHSSSSIFPCLDQRRPLINIRIRISTAPSPFPVILHVLLVRADLSNRVRGVLVQLSVHVRCRDCSKRRKGGGGGCRSEKGWRGGQLPQGR